jgi:phosphate transport system substrate-binding protein
MKKLLATILTPVLLASMAINAAQTITIKGSDTMVILAQRWAEAYMAKHPGTVIQVTGGGSGVGLAALVNGATDIATSSRPMKSSEMNQLKERYASLGVEVKTAKDGITVYVSESNSVSELTLDQIKDIYTGKITNWKDVGGTDAKIIMYGRENSSGTFAYFRDNVLKGKDYAPNTQHMPGTAAVVNAVSRDKNGIGYGGAAYAKGVKEIAVKKDAKSLALKPTAENIKAGTYPISRYLYLYLRSRPTGETKEFIDWVLSPEGQGIATKVGYFPAK